MNGLINHQTIFAIFKLTFPNKNKIQELCDETNITSFSFGLMVW